MATGRVPTTANSPLTAKGDLFGYSTTQARVAVGNNGESLVADSSTSTGLRYTAGTVQANPVLNSAFQVWQRGTSFAITGASNAYTADRYQANRAVAGMTLSRQTTSDTTNLPFIQYCARIQRDSGNTSTSALFVGQSFETVNSIAYTNKAITFSFYARAGANFSATGNTLNVTLQSAPGTDQSVFISYPSATNVISSTATLTTTWQRFTFTGTVPATNNEMAFYVHDTPTGTAGAADYFEVTGFQIDVGSVALPFRTNAGTIQGELAACQRYYERITADNTYGFFGNAIGSSTTLAIASVPFKVTKRVIPTAIDTSAVGTFQLDDGASGFTATALAINAVFPNTQFGSVNITSSGMTQYRPSFLVAKNSTTAYIGFTSEL